MGKGTDALIGMWDGKLVYTEGNRGQRRSQAYGGEGLGNRGALRHVDLWERGNGEGDRGAFRRTEKKGGAQMRSQACGEGRMGNSGALRHV